MSSPITAQSATVGESLSRAKTRDGLYLGMSILLLLIVLTGFAPTFFMRGLFDPPPISPYVYMHGAVMTAWFVLFFAQASLAYIGRTPLHRKIGIVAATLGFAAMLTAASATWNTVVNPNTSDVALLSIVFFGNIGGIITFTTFLTLAIAYRNRPEIHKRLMLFTSISFVSPAIGRIAMWPIAGGTDLAIFNNSAIFLLILGVLIYELVAYRRVHTLTIVLGFSLMAMRLFFNMVIASSSSAQEFVRAVV